jgi:hypothetical protein
MEFVNTFIVVTITGTIGLMLAHVFTIVTKRVRAAAVRTDR